MLMDYNNIRDGLSTPNPKKSLKIFLSYNHKDNDPKNKEHIENFKIFISPLKDNKLIDEWYDRCILPGQDFDACIDNKLEDADVICLFISAFFLASNACKKEITRAMELKETKNISVVPIILSECGWKEDSHDICKLLALPTDANSVSSYPLEDQAWKSVYDGFRDLIYDIQRYRSIKINDDFENFLNSVELLENATSNPKGINLDNLFISPNFDFFDNFLEFKEKVSFSNMPTFFSNNKKIVISGDGLSGKTTICKMLFKILKQHNYLPLYIDKKTISSSNKFKEVLINSFNAQYDGFGTDDSIINNKDYIVPIIDDFHQFKNKDNIFSVLNTFTKIIIITDDIYTLNLADTTPLKAFVYLKINELSPSSRYNLVKKWVNACEENDSSINGYKSIDEKVEMVDSTLGRTFGSGVMPAYPFYILSSIIVYETMLPLNQDITNQGYCYQALIYLYLRKQGVLNNDVDTHINFLTEIAYNSYSHSESELSDETISEFIETYSKKFIITIDQQTLLRNIKDIIHLDTLGNYSFKYKYLYYFFVSKYLSEHINEKDISSRLSKIFYNLHINENAYIAIFLIHHTKNTQVLEDLALNALCLFDKVSPASLSREETKFFNKQINIIINAVLPSSTLSPEEVRSNKLKIKDSIEEKQMDDHTKCLDDSPLDIELRRAIKTVDVIGCIIKNRAGSIEKIQLEQLFEYAMEVNLKILSAFFKIISNEEGQKAIISHIEEQLNKIEKESSLTRYEREEEAKFIFWNINYFFVYGIIKKIIVSLGSNKLIKITNNVCNKIDSPASLVVKHGILMWYTKNIQTQAIISINKREDFSNIAQKTLRSMIIEHCLMHEVHYSERQKLTKAFNMDDKKMRKKMLNFK